VSDWRRTPRREWAERLAAAGTPSEVGEQCAAFVELLARWDPALDLIGRVDGEELLRAHLLESLAGAAHLPAQGRMLDIGSGNGFPAIPLLLARPGLAGVLLEPRERRWGFLREVVRELGLDAEVRRARIEEVGDEGFAAITVRALAERAWRASLGRLSEEGTVLLRWVAGSQGDVGAPPGWEPVLTSRLPDPRRGNLVVWRRCST
jgi:16S rRNA (guanine(527)-N(7))-methyltransferase RsmG